MDAKCTIIIRDIIIVYSHCTAPRGNSSNIDSWNCTARQVATAASLILAIALHPVATAVSLFLPIALRPVATDVSFFLAIALRPVATAVSLFLAIALRPVHDNSRIIVSCITVYGEIM